MVGQVIERKDRTSIACSRRAVKFSERKVKCVELVVAIVLIVAGTSLMLLVP